MDDLSENLNKKIVSIKKDIETLKQSETKNTISEVKNTLEGIKSRGDEAEDWISDLEDKKVVNTSRATKRKEKIKKIRKI